MESEFNALLELQEKINEIDEVIKNKVSEISYAENLLEIKGVGEGTVAALLGESDR